MTMTRHTSSTYENELNRLRDRLITMGERAEAQLREAMQAVIEHDAARAARVVEGDDLIDRDEVEIDDLAQRILATRQPVASDLRSITMALKLVTDLERIGDLAANIAKRAQELMRLTPADWPVDFDPLARQVEQNLHEALESFAERDVARAAKVIEADREVDRLNSDLFNTLIQDLAAEQTVGVLVLPLTSIARALERIGDHAKNLAEEVVYMVRGRDVRHRDITTTPL
ncbi:MAG: phosphate signaling complex protein PhoU [Deltaproteobacteria bacterium]|nr:phosphate signaling complex protein PhoU [Deltaproteobacteria bacterium]